MHAYMHIRHQCNPPSENPGYGPDIPWRVLPEFRGVLLIVCWTLSGVCPQHFEFTFDIRGQERSIDFRCLQLNKLYMEEKSFPKGTFLRRFKFVLTDQTVAYMSIFVQTVLSGKLSGLEQD